MKLIIYGDSFAGLPDRFESNAYCWGDLLAKKLNSTLVNKAIAGSSLEYSIRKFVKDCHSNYIEKNDIIIFVMTHTGRLHLDYQNAYPKTATQYQEIFYKTTGLSPDNWYLKNKDFLTWYKNNIDYELLKIHFFAYTHMFSQFAKKYKDITFLVLDSFPKECIDIASCESIDNFIYPKINLFEACKLEFFNFTYDDWVKYTKSDSRCNHFSNVNLHNLANSLYKVLINKDPSYLSYDSFKKDVFNTPINNLQIYENYIENSLLFKGKKFIDILKK